MFTGDLVAIDVGAEVDGFAHVSVLDDEFVDDARHLLNIGDEAICTRKIERLNCDHTTWKAWRHVRGSRRLNGVVRFDTACETGSGMWL